MKAENYIKLDFPSRSCNEAFARGAAAREKSAPCRARIVRFISSSRERNQTR